MHACGVVVEYNPFHNGHRYHLSAARSATQADTLIAVMSGNFLQRGEPAIWDKWQRAEEALNHGADLVVELPCAFAVQPADLFAEGAVKLLHALKCTTLCFGTDSSDNFDYADFANFFQAHQAEIQTAFREQKASGLSYPAQMTRVLHRLYPNYSLHATSPNHILGLAYSKANSVYAQPMTLYPIQRQQADYHQQTLSTPSTRADTDKPIASATALRKALLEGRLTETRSFFPATTAEHAQKQNFTTWEDYWPFLRYQLLASSPADLRKLYQMVEGIEHRLKKQAESATSFDQFLTGVKTKRFTWTRLARLCVYCLLQMTATEIERVNQTPYIRVLGFTDQGRLWLNQIKKTCPYPIITRVAQANERQLALDIRAGKIYSLSDNSEPNQDFYRKPFFVTKK